MQWGSNIAHWEHLIEIGREVPQGFYEMPEAEPHLVGLLYAFNELGTERQFGMSLGPIPRSKMKSYLIEELALDGEDLDYAIALLRRVDGDYLEMIGKHNKTEAEKLSDQVKASDGPGVKKMVRRMGKKR